MQTSAFTLHDMRIRFARATDVQPLAALAEQTFRDTFASDNSAQDMEAYVGEAFSLARVGEELSDSANTFLLAYVGNTAQPVGYAKLRHGPVDPNVTGPEPVELQRLYVECRAIGHGIGAALMEASFDTARVSGYRTLWLGVWERNPRAISFYERRGFRTVGDHVFRLGSDDQRDLVMARTVAGVLDGCASRSQPTPQATSGTSS